MNRYLRFLNENKLTLIMSLPANDPALCEAAFDAGADVVKVHINLSHRASGVRFGSLYEERASLEVMLNQRRGPIGIVPGGSLEEAVRDLRALQALPFTFYSLYARHIPATLLSAHTPVMAACDSSYSLDEIESYERCGAQVVEAYIIPAEEYDTPMTLLDLARYSAIVRHTSLPVVVPTQRHIFPSDVPALLRAGVRGLMLGAVVTGQDRDSIVAAIRSFRSAIRDA